MRNRGQAPAAYQVNGRLLWKRSEVIAWVESNVSNPTNPVSKSTSRRRTTRRGKTTNAKKK
jgi:hypothetical protein